jgi:hypothetical protein
MDLKSSRVRLAGGIDEISDAMFERGYTDGLPVVPPTEERVHRMLAGTTRPPGQSLGKMPPAQFDVTIEKIAINAVMAGCRPNAMPVLIAAIELMLDPRWDLGYLQTTTNPLTPLLIVNGPAREAAGLSGGTGAMGPGFRGNATIGRAIRLVLLNIGGATPGDIDKCTQGFVGKYGMCLAENEEESPWTPLHVARGFAKGESVVTVVGVNASTNIHDSSDRWQDLLKTLTGSLKSPGTANVADPNSTPVILINPLHARILSEAGYTMEKLREHFFRQARIEADELSGRRRQLRLDHGEEHFLVEGKVPVTNAADRILIAVVGGMSGGHSCFLPNGHYGYALSKRIGG